MSNSNTISEKKVKYITTGDLSFYAKDAFSKYVLSNDKEEYKKAKKKERILMNFLLLMKV